MSAAQIPGTPAPATPTLGSLMTAPEGAAEPAAVETPADDAGGDEDPVAEARRKAREVLFSDKEPEEAPAEEEAPKPKPKAEEPKPPEAKPSEDEIALSREWKKFRMDRKAFDAERKQWESGKADREANAKALDELKALKNDPVTFLTRAGWSKERIIEFISSDGKVDPELLIKQATEESRRQIEELRAERQREQAERQREQEAYQQEKNAREFQRVRGELDSEVSEMVRSGDDLQLLQRFVSKKGIEGVQTRVRDIIAKVWNEKQQVVDPRDVLVYLESELAALQLGDSPARPPAVQPAKPAAVEPRPITNRATSQRTVVPSTYDETDPEARRERAAAILRGEIEPDDE